MKRIAERKPVIGVVEVTDPIQVRLALRVVPPDIASLTVAIKGCVQSATHATTLRMLSGLNRIRHNNALALCTKYLHFL